MDMKKKYVFLLIPVAVILLLMVLLVKESADKENLILNVAPESAIVTLDNNRFIRPGNHVLPEGKHTVAARKEGFGTVTKSFTISNDKTMTVDLLLNPNSEVGYDFLRKNEGEQLQRETLGGKAFDQKSSEAGNKNPLIYELPFIDQFYRIDYGASQKHPNDPTATAIYITLYNLSAREDALAWIRFKGYDPNKLEVIYVAHESSEVE